MVKVEERKENFATHKS